MSMSRDSEDIAGGVVQLRFADDEGRVKDISAADMASVLQGLVTFTSEIAKSGEFGDGPPPEVRIRAPKEGSFIIEAVLAWASDNPIATIGSAFTTGAAAVASIRTGIRRLRGERPSDVDYLANGDVKLKWPDGTFDQMRPETWDKLREMKRPTQRALAKLLTPLGNDADRLEIRDAEVDDTTDEILHTPADAVAARTDYLTAVTEPDEITENEEIFEAEGRLGSVDFGSSQKWRVETTAGTRRANIEDQEFLLRIDRGEPIHKDDIFTLTIRENSVTKNGRTSTDWSVIEVRLVRRGGDEGDDEHSAPAPSD